MRSVLVGKGYSLPRTAPAPQTNIPVTDDELRRDNEVVTDMSKSRDAGSTGYRHTPGAFIALFDRYVAAKLVP